MIPIAGLMEGAPIQYASQYNAAGFRTQLNATIGGTADFQNTYWPNALQRLVMFRQEGSGGNPVAPKRFDFQYNRAGQVTALHRFADPSGLYEYVASSHYQYDQAGRLQRLTHAENASAPTSGFGTNALAGYQFTYDAASRITQVSSLIDGLSSYGYDKRHQLKTADHAAQSQADEAYQYDANGNRTGGGYVTGLNNQVLEDGTYRYAYDAEGNRIRRTHLTTGRYTEYDFDHRNRLIRTFEVDPAAAANSPGQGTAWGWGNASGTGYGSGEEGGLYDWGSQWGSDSVYFPGPEETSFAVTVMANAWAVTEGNTIDLVIEVQIADEDYQGWGVEYWTEDVSAVHGLDYVGSSGVMQIQEGWPVHIAIPTIDDAIKETTQSFKIFVRLTGTPAEGQTNDGFVIEGQITDNDAATSLFSATALPAVEGEPLTVNISGFAEYSYEYYVQDVSAVQGLVYWGATSWTTVGPGGQIVLPTAYAPVANGTRSFRVFVRVTGDAASQVELEADIYDFEAVGLHSLTYAYDVFNRLVRRTAGPTGSAGASERFFSWEANQIVLQFDGQAAGSLSHRYAWNPLATDHILADENALSEVLWPLLDHLGTARDIVRYDAAANDAAIVNHRIYDSYGRLFHQSDDGHTIAFGFTGVYVEIATGLQYNRARWYDPLIGKWISLDPIGFAAGDPSLNRYSTNSPVNRLDPDGLADLDFQFSDGRLFELDFSRPDLGGGSPADADMMKKHSAQAEQSIRRVHKFDDAWVIPPPRFSGILDSGDGKSGFVIGIKGKPVYNAMTKTCDFSKVKVTLIPYAIYYNNPGGEKLNFAGEIIDGPGSTKEHEAWHIYGMRNDLQDKAKARLGGRQLESGIGYVGGFKREMRKLAEKLGPLNEKRSDCTSLMKSLSDGIRDSVSAIKTAGGWHTDPTDRRARFDVLIN